MARQRVLKNELESEKNPWLHFWESKGKPQKWHAKEFVKIKATSSEECEWKADSCCVKCRYYRCRDQWQGDHFTLLEARNGRKPPVSGDAFCISTSRWKIWIPASKTFISRMQWGAAHRANCMKSMQEEFMVGLYLNQNLYWSFLCCNLFVFIYIFISMYIFEFPVLLVIVASCSEPPACHCRYVSAHFVCVHITLVWTWLGLDIANLVSNIPGSPCRSIIKYWIFSLLF